MNDKFLVAPILVGVVFMVTGWVWSMLVARKVSSGWLAGMAFVFIIALPLFALQNWDKAKKPFLVSLVGLLLTYGSAYFI